MHHFMRLAKRAMAVARAPGRLDLLHRQSEQILEQLTVLNERVSQLAMRESQLRAILQRDGALEAHQARLLDVISNDGTGRQVERAVRRAELHLDPLPYAVIDDLLAEELYGCLLKGIPPLELFADRPINKQHLMVPFPLAPAYSQRVWRFMANVVVPELIAPQLIEKLRGPIDEWVARNWPDVPPGLVEYHTSGGRLLLRRRGYRIPPHRDPKWGFVTCILYLARRGDNEAWGTQLYTVDGDEEAPGAAPHWIDPARCRQVADVPSGPIACWSC